MTKLLLISAFFFTLTVAQGQPYSWTQLSLTPAHYLFAVDCINYDTVVAVGDSGYIIRTLNNGVQWVSITSNTNNTLYKVKFVNDSIGFAVGTKGTILKTIDYGQSWSNIGINTNMNLMSISFINKDTGWVGGGDLYWVAELYGKKGILMKTTNGGQNWTVDSSYNGAIASVFFINNDIGYICENYHDVNIFTITYLKKTTNSGNSFSIIKQDSVNDGGYFTDVQFVNPSTGYFVLQGHILNYGIFRTTDYGNTWTNILSGQSIRSLYVTDSCSFYYSYWDMPGSGFLGIDTCSTTNFYGISGWVWANFINRNKGFAVGQRIYRQDTVSTGVSEEKLRVTEIFPNPFSIQTTLQVNKDSKVATLTVYNSYGQQVKQIKNISGQTVTMFRDNLPSGLYFLHLTQDNKVITADKLVVTD